MGTDAIHRIGTLRAYVNPLQRRPAGNEAGEERQTETGRQRQAEGASPNAQSSSRTRPEFSPAELQVITELKARDTEVKAHEMAHVSAGGSHVTSGASYKYQRGPDGQSYAVGGEVGIDTSTEKDPRATVQKMRAVRSAALAPRNPSAQDRRVAALASQKMMEAQAEITRLLEAQRSQNTAAAASGSTDATAGSESSPTATLSAFDPYRSADTSDSGNLGLFIDLRA